MQSLSDKFPLNVEAKETSCTSPKASSSDDSATKIPSNLTESLVDKGIQDVRNFNTLKEFNDFITELSTSQKRVTEMMSVLLPGHKPARELVQALWEGLYAHFTEEDWKLSDYNSLSSTMQRLTSMQNQFDALEMRRLEFARDHKALAQFSARAIEAVREHSGELSPEALERIEQSLKIF